MKNVDLVIIGGGPAGLSAAIKASEEGIDSNNILIIDRNHKLGGILNQCIHNGFGLHVFKEELTGPEYAYKLIDKVIEYKIPYTLESMVIDVSNEKIVTYVSKSGIEQVRGKAIILSMGCREKSRGAIAIPGSRCAGIFTAGTCQEFVNLKGYMPGKNVVILGSGDIGLIMARRLTLEGANVKCVLELLPYSSGLKRNIAQCLNDYNIPLKLNHTVTRIVGDDRIKGVYVCAVDEKRNIIEGSEEYIECDTLLLSVGLIPENELSKKAGINLSKITGGPVVDSDLETNVDGIFSCGNVLHVHDLVDNVTFEAESAAVSACKHINGALKKGNKIPVINGNGVRYTVPSEINIDDQSITVNIKFRCDNVYKNRTIGIYLNDKNVRKIKKRILTPGEMEEVNVKLMAEEANIQHVLVKIEEE